MFNITVHLYYIYSTFYLVYKRPCYRWWVVNEWKTSVGCQEIIQFSLVDSVGEVGVETDDLFSFSPKLELLVFFPMPWCLTGAPWLWLRCRPFFVDCWEASLVSVVDVLVVVVFVVVVVLEEEVTDLASKCSCEFLPLTAFGVGPWEVRRGQGGKAY